MTLRIALRWLIAAGVVFSAAAAEFWHQALTRQMAAICAEMPDAGGPCAALQQAAVVAAVARWVQAAAFLALLLWVLDMVLRRYVDQPAQALKEHFRRMVLGQWRSPLSEVAQLAPSGIPGAVKELGEELETAFLQLESATRRSSLALFVRNAEQRLDRIAESVEGIRVVVEAARVHRQIVPPQAVDNLRMVSRLIVEMRESMDAGFAKELEPAKTPPGSRSGTAASRRARGKPFQVA